MADQVTNELDAAAGKMKGLLDDPHAAQEPKQEQEVAQEAAPEEESAPIEESTEEPIAQEAESTEEAEPSDEDATDAGAETGAESIDLGAEDLSEILNLNEDRIHISDKGSLSFKVKGVDGEEDVSLEKLLNAYQGDANLTNRSKQISELEKVRSQELQDFKDQITQQAQQAAITLEAVNNAYLTEFQSIDWNQLKAEDPAMWSAKTVEMQQKKAQLDGLVQQTLTQINDQQATIDNETAATKQQRIVDEAKTMQDGFKALGVKVDEDLQNSVIGYLSNQFGASEMENLVDSRIMLMAWKASQYEKGLSKAKSKEVKKKPRVLRPGKKPAVQAVKLNEAKKAQAKLKKTGREEDAAALLRGRI